ncbi:MAG: hypothetical protein IH878_14125 [Gemmatimonadetes bacterium]|nr:hypothetical protein [Gemmatimonadota bacterium]
MNAGRHLAMSNLSLNANQSRQLLADWFVRLARDADLKFDQRSASSQSLTIGNPKAPHVVAKFTDQAPYLQFVASDEAKQTLVDELANQAVKHVENGELGGVVWYSTELHEVALTFGSHSTMSPLLLRLANQVRIQGWRRLGTNVLLEFEEEKPDDWDAKPQILAPEAIVKAHVAAPGPCAGDFSKSIAKQVMELVEAVCTFALGRPFEIPHTIFSSKDASVPELEARGQDAAIPNLARKGVSLDVFDRLRALGGLQSFERARASLLTFDAAVRQERDPVAYILYVVAAEALTTPFMPWRTEKLTKRFKEFFNELMPKDLDEIVAHANFEEAFAIKRGTRAARALRFDVLNQIYASRSGLVHKGIGPSYDAMMGTSGGDAVRRGLLSGFAEMAILRFLEAPRSSIVGHPAFDQGDGA